MILACAERVCFESISFRNPGSKVVSYRLREACWNLCEIESQAMQDVEVEPCGTGGGSAMPSKDLDGYGYSQETRPAKTHELKSNCVPFVEEEKKGEEKVKMKMTERLSRAGAEESHRNR